MPGRERLLPHLEDDEPSSIEGVAAESSAAIDATDPGSMLDTESPDAAPVAASR